MKVLVTGAAGFIGSNIAHALRAQDVDVRALVRDPAKGERLANWGAEVATGDVTDANSVLAAARGCTHIIHLVGILRGRPSDFEQTMVVGTRNVLDAARAVGAQRLVQMSALGVGEHTRTLTPYFAAKWQLEDDVRASGLQHVIIRPSMVFAADRGLFPMLVSQVRHLPVVPVIGSGRTRLQPVWIDDVVAHFVAALERPGIANQTFDLGGPDQLSWNELYLRIAGTLGKRRSLLHIPAGLARTGARLTEWIPGSPLTADEVTMIEDAGDNVVSPELDAARTFDLPCVPLDEQIKRAC
jgi:NADH dehydrogenase